MTLSSLSRTLILVAFLTTSLYSQSVQSGLAPPLPTASAASYYYIAKPGELTMQVNVWGFVRNPGRYEVTSSTDLIQLLSFAGGPIEYAKLDEVKITRIVRNDSLVTKREIVLDLERLDKIEDSKLVLNPGDTIFIGHTSWLTIRDAFSVITTAAIITSAIAQIISVTNR